MKTLRNFSFLFVLLLGANLPFNAHALTHTVTFTGVTGTTLVESDANTKWAVTGGKDVTWTVGNVKIELGNGANHKSATINATVPSHWHITAINFTGGTPNANITYVLKDKLGTELASQNNANFTGLDFSGDFSVTLSGAVGSFLFDRVEITYTADAAPAPVLTYFDWVNGENGSNEANPHEYTTMPTRIKVKSTLPLYVGGVPFSGSMYAQFSFMTEEISEYIEIGDAITGCLIDGSDATKLELILDNSKLDYCRTYTLSATGALTNSDGVSILAESKDWCFTTPSLTDANFTYANIPTELTQGAAVNTSEWDIFFDGVNVKSDCQITPPSTATAGAASWSFTYRGCTITKSINVVAAATYTVQFVNDITNETYSSVTVTQGSQIGTLPTPAQTVVATDCGDKEFVGWSMTPITTPTDEMPALISPTQQPTANRTLYAVYADRGSTASSGWSPVTALVSGKSYLIASASLDYVFGGQNTNNFGTVGATTNADGLVVPNSGFQTVTATAIGDKWTLQLDNGMYLCATGSNSNKRNYNYLQTMSTIDATSTWAISFSGAEASVIAQGTNTNRTLRFNSGSNLFSCYSGGQQPISILESSGGTGFLTKCQCTQLAQPSGLQSSDVAGSSATLSWNAVTGASSYLVEYRTGGGAWQSETVATNTCSLMGLSLSSPYTWRVTALGGGTYCAKSPVSADASFTTTSNCSWQIDYQPTPGAEWSVDNCFSKGENNSYYLNNFVLPAGNCEFWVGPGQRGTYSSTVTFAGHMPFMQLQGTSCNIAPYPGEGAIGTLRIYSNSTATNYYVAFLPTYQITYGIDQGAAWENVPFAWVEDTKHETAVVTVPAGYFGNSNFKYYVGAKKTDGTTAFADNKSKTLSMNTMGGLSGVNREGQKGVFRIYENLCDYNWYCLFVPYYYITYYYAADNATVFAEGTAVSSEGDAAARTVTVITSAPTKSGFRFEGWATTAGGAVQYQAGQSVELTGNMSLYPVYVEQASLVYNGNGGSTTCESETVDKDGSVTVCAEAPTRENYGFVSWNTAQDGSGTTYQPGQTITLNANTTLYAQYSVLIPLRYDKTNVIYPEGCGIDRYVVAGEVITMCGTPTSILGYTFKGWKVNGASVVGSYTVTGTETEVRISPEWNVPSYTLTFLNQGAGTEQQQVVATLTGSQDSYVSAPTSCGTVPTNCDGKVFVGWLNCEYDGSEDGTQGTNNEGELKANAEKLNGMTAGAAIFVPAGGLAPVGTADSNWYAVFAVPE